MTARMCDVMIVVLKYCFFLFDISPFHFSIILFFLGSPVLLFRRSLYQRGSLVTDVCCNCSDKQQSGQEGTPSGAVLTLALSVVMVSNYSLRLWTDA